MASIPSSPLPDPEAFAGLMRRRAEDALSASVHHASISQQYLSLAQKFTGLAEQSAFGPGGMFEYAERLDREAATGIPAVPSFPAPRFPQQREFQPEQKSDASVTQAASAAADSVTVEAAISAAASSPKATASRTENKPRSPGAPTTDAPKSHSRKPEEIQGDDSGDVQEQ